MWIAVACHRSVLAQASLRTPHYFSSPSLSIRIKGGKIYTSFPENNRFVDISHICNNDYNITFQFMIVNYILYIL